MPKSLMLFLLIFFTLIITSIVNSPESQAALQCGTADRCDEAARICRVNGDTWDAQNGVCKTKTSGGLIADLNDTQGKVEEYLQLAVNIVTAVAGLAIVSSVIISGIQYSTSGGNPQATAKAKERITQAIIALVASLLLYTFMQWLIPGGVFS